MKNNPCKKCNIKTKNCEDTCKLWGDFKDEVLEELFDERKEAWEELGKL